MNRQFFISHPRTEPSVSPKIPLSDLSKLDSLKPLDKSINKSSLLNLQPSKSRAYQRRQSMKFFLKKKKSNQVLSMNEIYLKKLEINFSELEQQLKPILNIITELQLEIRNKQTLQKVIENQFDMVDQIIQRMLKDNCLTFITFLLIESDKNEIVCPLTFETIRSKLNSKAFTFYQMLVNETKNNFLYKGLKPAQCLFKQILEFNQVLDEFQEVRKEEKMHIMKGNIVQEWKQINNLMYNNYDLRMQFKKKKEKFYPLSQTLLKPYSPGDTFEQKEMQFGQFSKISQQQRRYNNNLSNIVSEIKHFEKALDYDYFKKPYLQ